MWRQLNQHSDGASSHSSLPMLSLPSRRPIKRFSHGYITGESTAHRAIDFQYSSRELRNNDGG